VRALAIAKHTSPDLVLLDINLPDLDGLEICKQLRSDKNTCEIPVIFLTARTSPDDIAVGFEAGAVDYVAKPFNSTELLARVKTHLELKRSKEVQRELDRVTTLAETAGGAAHEINQPLTVILGQAEILLYGLKEEEPKRKSVESILEAGNRINEIVRSMKEARRYVTKPYAITAHRANQKV